MADLGEQAISKVAEMGLSSQLDEVETLEVNIQTDPLKLVSGAVDAVSVKGEGLVMQKDLRVEAMEMNTGSISINPLSVAFGKIELNHPTEAETHVVLNEADINRAFNSEFIRDKMQNLTIHVNGELVTVDTQAIEFGLPGENKIALSTQVILPEGRGTQRVAFTAIPRVKPGGQQIVLEDVQYTEGQDLSPELTDALLQQAAELLDLQNFELEGMSLRLKHLDVQPGKLILQAEALIEQFPSA